MNILVIGELGIDIYNYGRVTKINAEAPTPVIEFVKQEQSWGMAGNVYNNLLSLRPDWEISFIHQNNHINKARFVDEKSGYILLRIDIDDRVKDTDVFNFAHHQYDKYDCIIISSYNKGYINKEDAKKLSILCEERNIPLFIDCKWRDLSWGKDTTYFKINKKEYSELENPPLAKNLILTLGNEGVEWRGTIYPCPKVEVRAVTGAGDVFLSCLAVKYMENIKSNMEHESAMDGAICYAIKGASYSVTQYGTTVVKEKDFII